MTTAIAAPAQIEHDLQELEQWETQDEAADAQEPSEEYRGFIGRLARGEKPKRSDTKITRWAKATYGLTNADIGRDAKEFQRYAKLQVELAEAEPLAPKQKREGEQLLEKSKRLREQAIEAEERGRVLLTKAQGPASNRGSMGRMARKFPRLFGDNPLAEPARS